MLLYTSARRELCHNIKSSGYGLQEFATLTGLYNGMRDRYLTLGRERDEIFDELARTHVFQEVCQF